MKQLIFILLILPALAFNTVGLGGKIGVAIPEDIDATFTFGFFGRFGISRNIKIESGIGYWTETETYYPFSIKTKYSDLSITGTLHFLFPIPKSNFQPYTGFGLGIHDVNTKNTEIHTGHVWYTHDETNFGFHMLGGANYFITPRSLVFGELRYAVVDEWYNTFSITWGFEFLLPQTR